MKHPQPVALSIPDLCTRTRIFEFSSFPQKSKERDAILRWRFQQELNISPDRGRLAYRVYQPLKPSKGFHNQADTQAVRVLATFIQNDILTQYEQACLEVGFLPVSVGIASTDVFDLYRETMEAMMGKAADPSLTLQQKSLFLYLTEWGFSFIAFGKGYPIFMRVKALRLPQWESHGSDKDPLILDHSHTQEKEGQAIPSQIDSLTLENELIATLQYYFESPQGVSKDCTALSLFFVEGSLCTQSLIPSQEQVENRLKSSHSNPPRIRIIPLPDKLSMGSPERSKQAHRLALPAYAGVMAA
jgi:hypothetical protein